MPQRFDEYLVEVGARALCKKYERKSPDDLMPIIPPDIDMRKKLEYGEPFWTKYRADAKVVIEAIFDHKPNL